MDPSNPGPGICAGGEYYEVRCDGPNDCSATQVCCRQTQYIENHFLCFDGGSCPIDAHPVYSRQVCDPMQPACPSGTHCEQDQQDQPYVCVFD
jgi:hypothetical protein